MPLNELIVVDRVETLADALGALNDLDHIGVDVERADWDRYYRAAALIQIGGSGRVVLVDPMAVTELQPLHDFLAARTNVFHAVENDLEPLVSLGVKPSDLCDTAIAAAVLGLPTGLEGLLRDLIGVELSGDKSAMQRANWEARPLTQEMLDYAAGDVADLPELWFVLADKLDEAGRRDWYDQELEALLALPSVEDRRKWSRTKGAGRLDGMARARLRQLWTTREQLGRDTDTAPGRIASDAVLVDLASTPPASVSELGRRGVRRQAIRDFGAALIAAVTQAVDPEEQPRRAGRGAADNDRQIVDQLRQVRAERAKVIGIDAGVLCPSRVLAPAVTVDPASPEDVREAMGLRPWQWEQLGHAFCEILDVDGPGRPPPPPDPPPVEAPDELSGDASDDEQPEGATTP